MMLIGFTSTLCLAQDFLVTFNNQTGEEHKGCVAYGYRADGTETRKDGVKPVPAGVLRIPLKVNAIPGSR